MPWLVIVVFAVGLLYGCGEGESGPPASLTLTPAATARPTVSPTPSLVGGACRTWNDCQADPGPGSVCLEPGGTLGCGYCDPNPSDECGADEDCPQFGDPYICRYTTSVDCGTPCFGTVLRCFPGCSNDGDCATGERCYPDHRCEWLECEDDRECPEHFGCGSDATEPTKHCRRIACDTDDDCDSGYCVKWLCYDELGTCAWLPP